MSDIGLNSNIYRISNKYLDRINKFLIELNFNPDQIAEDHVYAIHSLIEQLTDKQTTDFQIQMIFIVIDKYLKSKEMSTEEVLTELLNHFEEKTYRQPKAIEMIEMIASALDKECDHAFSRIQGNRPIR